MRAGKGKTQAVDFEKPKIKDIIDIKEIKSKTLKT